jgi:hypothetical protein
MSAASIPICEAVRVLLPKQWPDFCNACNRDCRMQVVGIRANEFEVECTGCGDERVVAFSRVTGEGV